MRKTIPAMVGLAIRGTSRDEASSPSALLEDVAVESLRRQAGLILPKDGAAPTEPCPSDTAPECASAARALIDHIGDRSYVEHWLKEAERIGVRVPSMALPAVLDWASKRSKGFPVEPFGVKGRWLAEQNPAWRQLFVPPISDVAGAEAIWSDGETPQRLEALRTIRRLDAARGLALLEAGVDKEPARALAAFMSCLEEGLNAGDEEFLGKYLGRSLETRSAARALLARLPSSKYVRDLEAVAREMLRYSKSFLSQKLEVSPPQLDDRRLATLGIKQRNDLNMSDRDGLMYEVISLVRPSRWQEWLGIDAKTLVKLARKTEFSTALLPGWRDATKLHGETELMEAIAWEIVREGGNENVLLQETVPLSDDQMEPILLELLKRQKMPAFLVTRVESHGTWSQELSRAVLRELKGAAVNDHAWWDDAPKLAFMIHAETIEGAGSGWPGQMSPERAGWLANFRASLDLRSEMIQTMKECVRV
jgi:hypothetical protein